MAMGLLISVISTEIAALAEQMRAAAGVWQGRACARSERRS
jgi:hypothetical protein